LDFYPARLLTKESFPVYKNRTAQLLDQQKPVVSDGACRSLSTSPSIVVIFLPWQDIAKVKQDNTGLPSIKTVQAPQSPCPQPFLVPVKAYFFPDNVGKQIPGVNRHFINPAVNI
jgi:hypothetical protein